MSLRQRSPEEEPRSWSVQIWTWALFEMNVKLKKLVKTTCKHRWYITYSRSIVLILFFTNFVNKLFDTLFAFSQCFFIWSASKTFFFYLPLLFFLNCFSGECLQKSLFSHLLSIWISVKWAPITNVSVTTV